MARPSFLSAISTPFRPDGAPDLDAFSAHLDWQAEAGLDGVFVAGTTGEGVLLEDDEVTALVERAAAADALRVVAQVGRPSTRATVRLARHAIELGADAVAAYVPWFYPATEADVRGHFLALLEAAGETPRRERPPRRRHHRRAARAGRRPRGAAGGSAADRVLPPGGTSARCG